ncbi:hypothetical protein [Mucilaginibacter flavidus]|uniref:hypothetical protein n=1 Tax=Mucilaginibacter flavidus TaxID=2949309 RepID=UPI002092C752|nr:hypothetical protein [Mucilaginibacter flavidus]MCO5946727.1 hypothetical protein [Mucilaginibacter flavidus]
MKEYDLDEFIKGITGLNYGQVFSALLNEITKLDNVYNRMKPGKVPYDFGQYRDHVGDFFVFLTTKRIPLGIGKEGVLKFLPVINSLIGHKQLEDDFLQLLQ